MSTRIFISNVRKFIRVPSKDIYNSLLYFLQEDLGAKIIEGEEETLLIKAKLRGVKAFGFAFHIHVFPENEASTIELYFSYKSFLAATFLILIGMIGLSTALLSLLPLLGIILLFFLIYNMGVASNAFLNEFNDYLLLLERDHEKKLLEESRKRWQSNPRNPNELYEKLQEKHIKVWGDRHVLDYKISEYMKIGLTREEAIRKIAEEEGIF